MPLYTSFLCALMLLVPASAVAKSTYSVGVEAYETVQYHPVRTDKYQPLIEELLEAFALEEGIKISYQALPAEQYQDWFEQHAIDFRFPDNPKWTNWHHTLFYSQPIISFCEVTRLLPENNWMRKPDISRLGTLPNHPLSKDWIRQVKKGYSTVHEYQTAAQLVRALVSGEVDAILGEHSQLEDAVAQLALAPNVLSPSQFIPDIKDDLRISSEKYPTMLDKFNLYIKTHRAFIAQIARRHGIDNGRGCTYTGAHNQSELAE